MPLPDLKIQQRDQTQKAHAIGENDDEIPAEHSIHHPQ